MFSAVFGVTRINVIPQTKEEALLPGLPLLLREIHKPFYEEKEVRRERAGETPARLGTGFRRA